jgi:hypothetical protein
MNAEQQKKLIDRLALLKKQVKDETSAIKKADMQSEIREIARRLQNLPRRSP